MQRAVVVVAVVIVAAIALLNANQKPLTWANEDHAKMTGQTGRTYADVSREEVAACLRDQGSGYWRASTGVTLADFCQLVGTMEMRRQFCADHPSKC